MHQKRKVIYGIAWFILSLVVSVALDVLQKHLGDTLGAFQITFLRFLFGSVVLLPFLANKWRTEGFEVSPHWPVHLFRGLLLFVGITIWCCGLTIVPLSTATVLVYSIPLFTLLLSVPILKENVDRGRWLATGIGFVGIVVVLNPSGIDFHPAILWLLFSSLLFALLDVFNKKYVSKESMLHMLFYTAFFTTVLSLTPALWTWHPMRAAQWGWLLAIGCGANLLLYCLLKSLQHMEASALAPFRYVDFGVSAFLGFLFFRETPSLHTCMGLVIIVPSTLFLAIREARKEQASP